MNEITLLVWLILGHVTTDFYLQPRKWFNDKNANNWRSLGQILHGLVHGLVASLVLLLASEPSIKFLFGAFLAIWVTHYLFGLTKAYASSSWRRLAIGQLLHLTVLLKIWSLAVESSTIFAFVWNSTDWLKFGTLTIIYLLAFRPASLVIKQLLAPQIRQINENENVQSDALMNGGRLIGYFERFIILTLILLSQYAAVGFILVAKSIFRFADLQDSHSRKLTEYVLLGTLISFAFVLSLGVIARWVLGM